MTLALVGLGTVEFAARDGAGPISVPGLRAGDVVIWSAILGGDRPAYETPGGTWEMVVSKDDELQQNDAGNLAVYRGRIVFVRAS